MTAALPLIVLATGGTGGHVFPAEALAAELSDRGYRLALVTDRRGGAYRGTLGNLATHRIRAGGIAGKSLLNRLKSILELGIGTLQARALLRRLKPAVVVGFGGYASLPTMIAASFLKLPTVIHEQNAILGRANRLLASRAKRIATSFDTVDGIPAEARGAVTHTGMPVRPTVTAVRDRPYPALDPQTRFEILILGGSQGAQALSDVVPEAVRRLPENLRDRLHIVQQCRPEDMHRVRKAYAGITKNVELAAFFDDVPERLARAHILIGRAGASTVAEVTAVGRPSILVPYPHAIDDHQSANAHAIDATGASWLMPQDSFTPETLAGRLESLIAMPRTLEKAAAFARSAGRPDAAKQLAETVVGILPAGGNGKERGAAA